MHVLRNILVLCVEIAAIAGVAWLGSTAPLIFAALTVVLVLSVGAYLEWLRLRHEFPFFLEGGRGGNTILITGAAFVEVVVKSAMAGVAAILTFASGDGERQLVIVALFAICLFAGTGLIRRGHLQWGVRRMRWGYFRLAVPLGVLFSLLLQGAVQLELITIPSLQSLAGTLVFDLPAKPSIAQLTDLVFNVRQTIDALITDTVARLLPPALIPVVTILVSLNLLTGFVLAIYAVLIAELVLRLENAPT